MASKSSTKQDEEALTHLSCSPNFPRASYLDERTLTYESIVNCRRIKRVRLTANTMTVLTVDFEMAIRVISVFWRNLTRNSRVR